MKRRGRATRKGCQRSTSLKTQEAKFFELGLFRVIKERLHIVGRILHDIVKTNGQCNNYRNDK